MENFAYIIPIIITSGMLYGAYKLIQYEFINKSIKS